jgi:Transposase DDE domain group 1
MTECSQGPFEFAPHFSRRGVAEFSADRRTSDGGVWRLRQVDHRLRRLSRFAGCFRDGRDPARVEHTVAAMVAQRVYGLALGYEDLNDHEQLRHDPLLGGRAGKRDLEAPRAGKSRRHRMEWSSLDPAARYPKIGYSEAAIDELLVDLFLESYAEAPARIVLDLDATDVPLHGHQEARFFHGYYDSYYDSYCYLPLYIFAGDHLLCARLRPADRDGAAGAVEETRRIVGRIRQHWPHLQIVVRADSGFCREEPLRWCEEQGVDYIVGLARNRRLLRRIGPELYQARQQCAASGRPARVFTAFDYRTRKRWNRSRRVVAKAEYIPGKENPRFVVTSLAADEPQALYEKLYCARGEMENRIQEQLRWCSDRRSTETLRANPLRVYFSALAYTLLEALRRLALQGTAWAEARVDTLRLRLLKIAAQVRLRARRIWLRYTGSYPRQPIFVHAWRALRG